MQPDSYFRAGVGMVVLGREGKVLALERSDRPEAWQFPQGGILPGETPEAAALRELSEETGLGSSDLEELGPIGSGWLVYELPPEYRSAKTGLGQVQKWFLYRARSARLPTPPPGDEPAHREAASFRWVHIAELTEGAVDFRKPVYRTLAREISKLDDAGDYSEASSP